MREYLVKDSKVVPVSAYKLTKDIYLREGKVKQCEFKKIFSSYF